MMRQQGWMLLVAGGMAVVVTSTAMAYDETKIKLEDLPKKVMAAAKKAFPEAKMIGAVKETDDDKKDELLYVIEMKIEGKAVEVAINDDAEIEAVEKEIEVDDLPKAVTRAAAKRFPNGKITKVEEVTDEDETVVYELDITNNGKKVEVVMSPNGKILDIDDDDDDDDNDKKKDKDDKKDKKKDKDKDEKKKDRDKSDNG